MESSKICADWCADHDERVAAECGWRGAVSLLSGVAWLSFVIIWLFFYAGDYTIWENIGVALLSLVALLSFNGAVWVGYGLRMAEDYHSLPKWRIGGTLAILAAGLFAFLYWLFFMTDGYNGYQNVAVLFVIALISLGSCAAIWIGYDETKAH